MRRVAGVGRWLWQAACIVLSAGIGVSSAAAERFDAVSALAANKGWQVSAEAWLLDDPAPLAQVEASQLMIPASVSKLYVAATMLEHFGPRYRFSTQLLATGPVIGDTLQGDLILDGSGDPALNVRDGWTLVQSLQAAGIRHITGQLRVSEWRFGAEPCLAVDRCRARDTSKNAYDARLSSAGFDYGTWCIQLTPTHTGEATAVSACDGLPLPPNEGQIMTVAAKERSRFGVQRVTRDQEDVLLLEGQLAEGSAAQRIYRASSNPARQSLVTLEQLLAQAGISMGGIGQVSQTIPPLSAHPVAVVEGMPLQMELMDMLAYSNNFMADAMTMALSPSVPASLAKGCTAIQQFVATIPEHGPLMLTSGSGLTPENRTSAKGIVALLRAFYQKPALFPALVGSMYSPKEGTSQFIRRASEPFVSHAMVKTGTLDSPVPVRAIGGYFRTAQGRWGAFAVLLNGRTAQTELNWSLALPVISSDIGRIIEAH